MGIQTFSSLDDVIELARFAHRNQRDKAGLPYFDHPFRVMQSVQAQGALPYVQMAAVLHDVTEDTAFTVDMLRDLGVPDAAVEIVRLLDREASRKSFFDDHNGMEIISGGISSSPEISEFYYSEIRKNQGALMAKLADIHDNTQQWRLAYLPEETQARLIKKYEKAKRLLGC